MADKKGTGWIPDYPDVRDYQIGEINQRLKTKAQDIEITTDIQSILDKIVDVFETLKNPDSSTLKEIDELSTTISGSFKLIQTKVLKEQIFLGYGSLGYEVYDFQINLLNLLKLCEYKDNFEKPQNQVDDLITSLKNFELVFDNNENHYIEYAYFGEFTKAAVKQFKTMYQLSSNTDDNPVDQKTIDSTVDQKTICKLKEVLEQLGSKQLKATNYSETNPNSNAIPNHLSQRHEQTKLDQPKSDQSKEEQSKEEKSKEEKLKEEQSKSAPKPALRIGSKNEKVKELQVFLTELGEFNTDVSGYFGPFTQEAVINFQKKYGELIVDGIVGEKTWGVLYYLVNRKKQQQSQRSVVTYPSPIPVQLYEIILDIFGINDLRSIFREPDEFKAEKFVSVNVFQPEMRDKDEEKLKRTINVLVKLVAQIISPLAQHINLEKTVKDILEQLDQRFDKSGLIEKKKPTRQERIEIIFKSAMENSGIFPKSEQKKDFLKEWDVNPASLPLAISTILNFIKALKKIKCKEEQDKTKGENQIISTPIDKSIEKIHEIFKSLKDSQVHLQGKNDKNNQVNQQNRFQTNIEILKDANVIPTELEKDPEIQSDLQLPIARNLHKEIRERQETIYLLMPESVDLSFWFSPIKDQGSLDSCTAYAGIALIEYFQKRSFDRYIDASPLFLYKVTRNLMHRQGDAGASLRETMKAMGLFGVAPEEYWPYQEDKFDEEPSPFCYSFAQNYQALKYFRLNSIGTLNDTLLLRVNAGLATGIPCAFGFTIYHSIDDNSNPKGHIPYPLEEDKVKGGHAAVAIGYDDHKIIENAKSPGALLVRNSWGTNWGEGGYGWLPYDYVLDGLTADWWSLLKSEWFETGRFGLGATEKTSNLGGVDPRTVKKSNPSNGQSTSNSENK